MGHLHLVVSVFSSIEYITVRCEAECKSFKMGKWKQKHLFYMERIYCKKTYMKIYLAIIIIIIIIKIVVYSLFFENSNQS